MIVNRDFIDYKHKEATEGGILGGDLVTEDGIVFQDGNFEEELLDSIERTMTRIALDLQVVGEEQVAGLPDTCGP